MKILAIASAGGHWIQLLRLIPAFIGHKLIFMSTKEGFDTMVPDYDFILVPDSNRNDKLNLIRSFVKIANTIRKLRPDVIITTGAAPGLMGLLIGKIFGAKTIWVDSMANIERLSLSGKLASVFAHRTYTQWPELTDKKIIYKGNVMS